MLNALRRGCAQLSLVALMVLGWMTPGHAGQFYEQNGVALKGYDLVAYFTEGHPVKGSPRFSADYLGSTFYFSTMSHRDTFAAHPERFAPQYGGYCAFGVAKGYKAAIDPEAFSIVEGKLYLNYSPSVLASWRKDIPGYIRQADRNWPEVSQHTNKGLAISKAARHWILRASPHFFQTSRITSDKVQARDIQGSDSLTGFALRVLEDVLSAY